MVVVGVVDAAGELRSPTCRTCICCHPCCPYVFATNYFCNASRAEIIGLAVLRSATDNHTPQVLLSTKEEQCRRSMAQSQSVAQRWWRQSMHDRARTVLPPIVYRPLRSARGWLNFVPQSNLSLAPRLKQRWQLRLVVRTALQTALAALLSKL
jgi:hypothetical protein